MHIELDGQWDPDEIKSGILETRTYSLWPLALIAAVPLVLVWLGSGGDPGRRDLAAALIAIGVTGAFLVLGLRRQVAKLVEQPSMTGPVKGTVTDSGLTVVSRQTSSQAPWSQFKTMRFNDSAAALITRQRTCLLVLRNWFPDQESWNQFTATTPTLIANPPGSAGGAVEVTPVTAVVGGVDREQEGAGETVRFGGSFTWTEHYGVLARMSTARRYGFVLLALGALVIALSAVAGGASSPPPVALLPSGLMIIVLGLVIVFGLPALATVMVRRGSIGQGFTGSADGNGIDLVYRSGQSAVRWSAIINVVRSARGVGLMMTDQAGIVIVRSWFASDADWQRFLALVDGNAAQSSVAQP